MKDFFELILSSFWKFVGGFIILSMILTCILFIWNRFWRHWNIRKHGYPPPHCDADGDFEKSDKEK